MPRNTHNAQHRFSAGLTAADTTTGGFVLPFPHPAQQGWKVLLEDFNGPLLYSADSPTWEYTTIGSGTAVVGTGGVSIANSGTTINEGSLIQSLDATIIPVSNTKKFYLEVSATITAVTMAGTEFFAGLTGNQGTTIAEFVADDGLSFTVDDCFGIGKLDTATSVSFSAHEDDAAQTISFGSNPTTATRHVWSVYYDGVSYHLYKDGAKKALESKIKFNNDVAMQFAAFYKSATGEAQVGLFQYIMFAYEL